MKNQLKSHWLLAAEGLTGNRAVSRTLDEIINVKAIFRRDFMFFEKHMPLNEAARYAGIPKRSRN